MQSSFTEPPNSQNSFLSFFPPLSTSFIASNCSRRVPELNFLFFYLIVLPHPFRYVVVVVVPSSSSSCFFFFFVVVVVVVSCLHSLKTGADTDSRWMKTAARHGKRGRSGVFGFFFFFSLHLNESREGFCRRGRGRSFHVDGPKTEKARAKSATCVVNHPLAWIKTVESRRR